MSNQYAEDEGQLTVLGLVQEYYLGQEMRKRYVEDTDFLSEAFNSSEVLIKSSWKNRTIRSAYAFVNGLYPQDDGVLYENDFAEGFQMENLLPLKNRVNQVEKDDIRYLKLNEEWASSVTEIIKMDGDLYFHAPKDGNCPPAEKIIKELKKSRESQEIESYLSLALYPQLAASINGPLGFTRVHPENLNMKKAKSVLDNYRCNTFHGKPYPQVDDLILKLLIETRYLYAYKLTLLDDMVRSVSSSKLFSEFLDFTRSARDQMPNTPKFIFYSAHDTNLEVLFSIFLFESIIAKNDDYNIIPFSSVLSIEIHKEQEEHYVKLMFNDEPQLIKWCMGYQCTLDQFHKVLEHHIVPSLDEFCSVGKPITPAANPDEVICVN
jgi:succinate dehydrogenase flavin-adding protein (antitoxin of CptAB toxin-antitoxin module)